MVKRKSFFALIAISTALAVFPARANTRPGAPDPQTAENRERLATILTKARSYCRRLETAALDFVCQEEVSERYDATRERTQELFVPGPKIAGYVRTQPIQMASPAKASNKYLYDFQFVRKNQQAKEKRELLEVNGKKSPLGSYAAPTQFQYENILFGPVGLLSESWQPYHKFEIIGEDIIDGEKWVVLEATLKVPIGRPHAYGRVWVKEADGSVFKIAWDQKSLGNFQVIEERAKDLKAEPQVTSLSEYGFEKNGLRFPSRDSTEEAYIKKDGKSLSGRRRSSRTKTINSSLSRRKSNTEKIPHGSVYEPLTLTSSLGLAILTPQIRELTLSNRCPACHADNPESIKFCGECGAPLPPANEHSPVVTETLQTPVRELTTGSTFADRYQIIEELGHGGMGRVYRVLDKKLNEEVALKLIKPEIASDKKTLERFGNELKIARKIVNKNVGRMYHLSENQGINYITMEYVPGENLKSSLRRFGPLPIGKTIFLAEQICEGLAEAHRLGIVHRDLKPGNIMIDETGNARIMDFGIARSLRERGITGEGVIIGTPEYMSPEQVEGKDVDPRSDIYSLGVILYEMVTGHVPFEGETPLSVAMKHKGEIPVNPQQLNPGIPDDLSGVILKCLEKDKEKRYQSVADVRSELEKIDKGIPTTDRYMPEKRAFPSKEVTVTLGQKRVLLPILGVLLLIIAAIVIWKIFPKKEAAPAASAKKSIAVLPFEDLSQAKNNEYLCDGISETLINALTNIEGLWVPARTSAFFFKGKTRDIREIGQKLGVENVLEGTVQVAGNNLRVTAWISNVKDGREVWSDIYNRKMADIFAIQDDIAKAIVAALKIRLLGEKGTPLIKNYTQNLEAYRLYLQGRNFWAKRNEADLIKSIEYFEKAITVDPNYALAYAGLGDAYFVLGNNGFWPAENAFPKAKAAAVKALEIDDKLAEAHTALAVALEDHDWDFAGAEKESRLAIELNPGYAIAHHSYAWLLSALGRHEEAIREIRTARDLDPLSPRISANVGFTFYAARRYSEALEELNKALEVEPNHAMTHVYLGWVYEAMGKYEEAIRCYLRSRELGGELKYGDIGLACCDALMAKREEARKILNDIIEYSKGHYVSSVAISWVFVALGEKDQVFAWLDKALRERDPFLLSQVKNLQRYDPVRSDPRFTALLRKIGLEK